MTIQEMLKSEMFCRDFYLHTDENMELLDSLITEYGDPLETIFEAVADKVEAEYIRRSINCE